MIREMYQEDDGTLCFLLDPEEKLMGLLPPDMRKQLDDPGDPATAEFYAYLDCRSMKIDVSVALHDCGGREISDLALELPKELAEDVTKAVYSHCEDAFGKDAMAAADGYLASCGLRMEIRDWTERLRHMDFGKMSYGVRDLYSDDMYPIFGDGFVIGVSERLPEFLKGFSAALKESGLGNTEFTGGWKTLDFTPIEFGERHENLKGHDTVFGVDEKTGRALMDGDYDIARHYDNAEVRPGSNCIVLEFQCKDSDDSATAWIGFDELAEIARPRQEAAHRSGPKP